KETESEDGETKRELVKTDGEDKPELIPEGAPSTTIELEETSPHSGEFTAVLEGTPRGVQAGDTKMNVPPDRLLRAAYEDETNISRRETWVVSSAMNIVPGSEGDIESPRTEDSSMSRRAQLDKGISLGELAKIYEDLGLEQMASDYYERALRTCGEVAQQEGLTSLGQEATHAIWELYFESGQPEKVIRACEQLVDEFPDSELVDEAYMTMGKALMTRAEEAEDRERNNYLRRAASALRRLLKARPESEHKAEALYTLGKVLFEAGEGGSDYMEQVVDEHPASSYAALALKESGEHAYDNKDYSSAYEYFQRIIRNYPDAEGIARVRFLSGHCQVRQRNFAEALDSYHDLINNHPGSKYAQQAEKIIEQIRKQMD
ncbi:MAG: outer membrane protein assembly factor BamD, partial [Planctomycetota bacterium]